MWLSGIRNASAIGLSTPIWCRTFFRSGRVGGSTSHTNSNPSPMASDCSEPYGQVMGTLDGADALDAWNRLIGFHRFPS
jgi:hypothetical protein